MATTRDRIFMRQLGTLFHVGATRELTDGQLLERFARGDGAAAELACAALVERHGAMVWRVCRSQLPDPHEAQDAFQATFLVLIEKARGLWVRDSLGPWLHQVALRTSACARSAALRRRRLERRAAEVARDREYPEDPGRPELARRLHEEIDRLPERYRVPLVLCDLEGRTCEEAARQMGRPVGTIKCWHARGRERLRRRLIRAGLAPAATLEVVLSRGDAGASVLDPAVRVLSDRMNAGAVPASVSRLVKGVIKSMIWSKLRTTAAALFALTALGAGLVEVARVAADDAKRTTDDPAAAQPSPIPAKPAALGGESWPMTLREAIRIGLDNNEIIRVIPSGAAGKPIGGFEPAPPDPGRADADAAPIVIAPIRAEADRPRLRSELMAEVRSIEQQYWNLGAAYVQLWATERAVGLTQETLDLEQAGLAVGRSNGADVAEASQSLERYRLDLVARISDVITTERQLRNLLGLPPADDRRIIPITTPTEARLEPDWRESLAIMLEKQPDIVMARAQVKESEGRRTAADLDRVAGAFLPGLAAGGGPAPSADSAGSGSTPLDRRKAFLEQVVRQTTHSLARFFLEIDASYKQFKTASRLRAEAAQRLDGLRADYRAGRVFQDRLLGAVRQYAEAVAIEAHSKARYNIALAALEECKGTLLEHDHITVADGDREGAPPSSRPDGAVQPASHQPSAPAASPIAPAPIGPARPSPIEADGARAKGEPTKADANGTTYSFHLTIGAGDRPFEVRGSFTVAPAGRRR